MKLSNVNCKYGAPMGRPSTYPQHPLAEGKHKLRLHKVPLDSGAYDSGGAYWGFPHDLYIVYNVDLDICVFFRAESRDAAKSHVLTKILSTAVFFR
jgi:hypothetical protein